MLTRSRQDADDLLQSGCERALTRLGQWQPDTRLDSWLYRILQTVWLNELRFRRVRDRYASAVHVEEAVEDGERRADTRVELQRVAEEVLALPENERVVLTLVCVDGLSYKEAAEVAGVPIGTIMSRLSRARLMLMNRLETPSGRVVKLGKR
jgi:RNA polymerase sigma-70 factor (ECF subfamily)